MDKFTEVANKILDIISSHKDVTTFSVFHGGTLLGDIADEVRKIIPQLHPMGKAPTDGTEIIGFSRGKCFTISRDTITDNYGENAEEGWLLGYGGLWQDEDFDGWLSFNEILKRKLTLTPEESDE